MALLERQEQKLEVLPNGVIQVQDINIIDKDGVEVSRTYSRKVIEVGDDVTAESQRIKDVSAATWTQAVIDARLAEIAAAAL